MGPRKPEIEYIHLDLVAKCRDSEANDLDFAALKVAMDALKKLADSALKKGPYSIVKDKKPPYIAASGDVHDFLSYAPYWWPSDANDGTYVRKDGKRNPDVKLAQDQSQLENFSEQFMYLCLGYELFRDEEYAKHAVHLLEVFFLNPETKMNPNVNYGQVIRGTNNENGKGRPDGLISTRTLACVANVLPALFKFSGYARIADGIGLWFQQYGQWLLTSDIGKQVATKKNNHLSWYLVQLVMIHSVYPLPSVEDMLRSFLQTKLSEHIDPTTGDQPLESQRTRPFHYLVFNLQALIYITEWTRDHPHLFGCQDELIGKAVDYLVQYDTTKTKEDSTEALRCVQQMQRRQQHGPPGRQRTLDTYQQWIDTTKSCENAENISGPKNALYPLWSR
ncbi:putative alginate lyase [Halteromyces radiatus]|uniref:putative alginate lyase n=1 Tax=Halteromyces radiatus TaxID=101107 RepID=UPI00221EA148|nr:putative alginate lyase [Halteromyces radiatus]KAI8097684.1 putative alginate lyase [Halteromyces radiatus]